MIWLEMTRDESHGGNGWGFAQCVWSPTHKTDGANWPFWNAIRNVRKGDVIFHLQGKNSPKFIGYSIASTDGFETKRRPPEPEDWGFSDSFYRADLNQYIALPEPIPLSSVFSNKSDELLKYLVVLQIK